MDLLRLLEIDRALIASEAQRSLLIAEREWSAAACPCDAAGLCAALEKTLKCCVAQGVWYAPVLLQRKKALERGAWRPRNSAPCAASDPRAAGPPRGTDAPPARHMPNQPPEKISASGACEHCGGAGLVIATSGLSASICRCGAYLRRYAAKASAPAKATGEDR